LNKTRPVEVTLRDKLNDFAHLLTKVGNPEKYSANDNVSKQLVSGLPLWKTCAHHK